MKLLVVTPTLGTSPWLAATVASVRAHAPESIHVLVAPGAAMDALTRAHAGCRTVPEPASGRGMYAAINAGLANIPAWDAFTYINDDDLLLPGFAEALKRIAPAAGERRPLMVYGKVRLINAAGSGLGAIPISPLPTCNRALYAERLEPVYQHGTLFTRAVWERYGGFDETLRYCGDSEYLARMCVQEVPAEYVGVPVAAFRLRAGQLTKHRVEMQAERAAVDVGLNLLKGPGRFARWRARVLFRAANLPVYSGRIWRHGFVSFDDVLERQG